MSDQPVRWGILGTANIAIKVRAALARARGAQTLAIASRTQERAEAWAAAHQIPRAYGSYVDLLRDPEIDAVYIPLPNSLHEEWTIRAAEHGKHVLCEKPLAQDLAAAQRMAAACRQHQVQFMDGVMWVHHPRAEQMARVLQAGALGTLRRFTSAFTFCWETLPEDNIRLSAELAGGSLGDLGWYCVRAALWAFGELPQRVRATAVTWRRGIDLNLSAHLWFSADRQASFDCGFDTVLRQWFEVAGTKGSLVCDDFVLPRSEEKARFWVHDRAGVASEQTTGPVNQEVRMIEDFCGLVQSGALESPWIEPALQTQRVIDAILLSARDERTVALGAS